MAILMRVQNALAGRSGLLALKHGLKPRLLAVVLLLLCCTSPTWADSAEESRLKVAFIYNFVSFTEWPSELGGTLTLCVLGQDTFGEEIDRLQGKSVGGRTLLVRRQSSIESLGGCQIVFIARPMMAHLQRVIDHLRGRLSLSIADTPGAARQGVALNLLTENNRIQFEANTTSARENGLSLSSKLLRLAKEVYQ